MKAQVRTLLLAIFSLSAVAATADEMPTKTATRIDFNRMIDENNSARTDLKKDIDQAAQDRQSPTRGEPADRAKVIDFIDVEVGVGEAPQTADRRFNSVNAARVYQMNEELESASADSQEN
ncbi:MAG TPA: hypothetical protein PKC28_10375 [Bdellovibrionales bacterium]|nr:hypothetical protein [Bdellovibrionales bacterium]